MFKFLLKLILCFIAFSSSSVYSYQYDVANSSFSGTAINPESENFRYDGTPNFRACGETCFGFKASFFATKGAGSGLKNASGSLDDAANAARNQRGSNPLTQHARQRMATRNVSNERVQEAIDSGTMTTRGGGVVNRTISASDSAAGRGLTVIQDVRTNNVITVIDKGRGGR